MTFDEWYAAIPIDSSCYISAKRAWDAAIASKQADLYEADKTIAKLNEAIGKHRAEINRLRNGDLLLRVMRERDSALRALSEIATAYRVGCLPIHVPGLRRAAAIAEKELRREVAP